MKYLLVAFGLIFLPIVGFAESTMLTCSNEEILAEKIDEIVECSGKKFIESDAKKVFNLEIESFDEKTVNKITLNDIDNPNWLSQKGIHDLREHKLCLERICDLLLKWCDGGKNIADNDGQRAWCEGRSDTIFEVQKTKIKTAVLNNQRRKTRSSWREKFRSIEVRMHRYFIPNLHEFMKEFERFIDKVTAFVRDPLSQ